jgi:hypothetical protein
MTVQESPPAAAPTDGPDRSAAFSPAGSGLLVRWLVQRGLLFVLLLTPVTALMAGLFRILPNRLGYLTLMLAFLALPLWVVLRGRVSGDPTEPVHHLHRYALYALFPYVVFSVVRIPAFYLFDFSYWAPWYTFGNGATGEPVGFLSSLVPGAVLYSLQGYSLSMGFYTLFKRHTLLNATMYFGLFIASLYSFVFPVFLMVGSKPGWPFHVINYWAHLWMGATAAFAPVFFGRIWPRLRKGARVAAVTGMALVWLAPYAFAFGQAGFWQFDRERRLEQAAFDRITLELVGPPSVVRAADETRYRLTMRVGPRTYVTYAHVDKAVGVDQVRLTGRLVDASTTVAWCTADTGLLPSTTGIRDPERYFPVLHQVEYATIVVTCAGPPDSAGPATALSFQWSARVVLHGERVTQPRVFAGSTPAMPA